MSLVIWAVIVGGIGVTFGSMWFNERRKNRSGGELLKVSIASILLALLLLISHLITN